MVWNWEMKLSKCIYSIHVTTIIQQAMQIDGQKKKYILCS